MLCELEPCEPYEPLPGDDAHERDMRVGSTRLLRAVQVAQGICLVAPLEPTRKSRPPQPPAVSLVISIPGEQAGQRIIRMTAEAYAIPLSDLLARKRNRRSVCARVVAARLLRSAKWADGSQRFSTPQIGKMLGRDHSTICYLLDMFGPYRRKHPEMHALYNLLRRRLAA